MNKKGDIFQVMFMLILIFAVAIVGLICLFLTTNINNFWDDSGLLNQSEKAGESIDTMQRIAPKTTDYTILFLFIGLIMGTTIAAIKTNFSVVTILLFIFLTMVAVMEAAGFVNLYRGLADDSAIRSVSQDLHWTDFIFSKYLPLLTICICALMMILMYAKSGGEILQ
ncbi:MAG: hypothetical protein ACFFHD_05635 [Promethearchaeota archaeon]